MKRFALAAAVLFAATAVNAQVYEWKDEKGKVNYSDKPPIGNPQAPRIIELETAATTTQKTSAERELEFRKRQKVAQENTDQAKKDETASTEKKDACENARRLLETLESGERIALHDGQGERYFMDDTQRQQQAEKARQAIQSNCRR